jgi:hypothetical protein
MITVRIFICNTELVERLKISDDLSYLIPDVIVIAVECIRIENQDLNAFVISTLTDKPVDVIQNEKK